jgi:transforming growth factor-beta-induced protein
MFRITSLFLASLAVPALAALGTQTSRQLQTSVTDLAVATASLSTLVTAVTTAGLAEALGDPEATLTVFAPNNDAFDALPFGLLDVLLTPGFNKHLTAILLFHVYADAAVLSSELAATQDITMLNGEILTVTRTDTTVTVTTADDQTVTVITADVEGSNGVVHVIDGVLIPRSIGASIYDLGSNYSTLLSLIATVGLDEVLTGSGELTLFAPTNAAFEALEADTVAFLTSDAGVYNLAIILSYHIVFGSFTSDLLVDGAMAATLYNQKVTFSVGESVMVNDATVIEPDMLALNGVSHGIDRILIPGTIADILLGIESLSTLATAVTTAGLAEALSGPGTTMALFGPDNDAFGALPEGLLTALLTPGFNNHLTEILLYHASDQFDFSEFDFLEELETQEIEMLNGEMLTVTLINFFEITVTTTTGQTFSVITPDLEGSNGFVQVLGTNGAVYILDGVLVPSSIGDTVIDLGSDYSTLLSLITRAGLEETLAGGPFTLLAPTNTAFEVLDAATVAFLTSDAGSAMLTSILTYHVISGSVTSDMLMNDMMVATVQGGMVTFMVEGGTVMVNDATVVMADMLAFNGVTHGIDRILMPPDSMAPTMAPASGDLLIPRTVVDIVLQTESLSTLATAITTAGLADALNDPRLALVVLTLTVLAPDNDAFSALPDGLLTALLSPGFEKHLTEILTYHVFAGGALLSSDLAATQDITMLNGEILTVTRTDTTVTVTTADDQTVTVITADVEGSNGVVHVIDGVLIPRSIGASVYDLGSNYSTLLALITRAGLEETLAGGPFTLLAPTNTAFAALDAANVAFLNSDAGAAMLTSILTYHAISGSVTSDMLMNDMMVATAQGGMVTFMVEGGTVMVNDATVVMADMLAFNGVTHGIDRILMPPDSVAPTMDSPDSVAPTMSPVSVALDSPDSVAPTMSPVSGAHAVGASLSALFAAVLAVAL